MNVGVKEYYCGRGRGKQSSVSVGVGSCGERGEISQFWN